MLAVFAVYGQVSDYEFISFDDHYYITDNPHVRSGLSLNSIKWAFKFPSLGERSYWHPITWISHMIDVQLFGLDPGWHHISNLFYHSINTILLFICLKIITQKVWRSAFVAALFALHPVNVDSVAWVAERKNLLAVMFMFFSIIAYYYYTIKTEILLYSSVAVFFCIGLLAKPTIVTLPFILLLLDIWPLKRIKIADLNAKTPMDAIKISRVIPMLFEKMPLFIISIISIVISSSSMSRIAATVPTDIVPLKLRVANAAVSYIKYLGKIFWPSNLTIFYPYPEIIPSWEVWSSVAIILTITIISLLIYKIKPYSTVGWFWYVGTLVPVLGIVQGGRWPEIAERFLYLPMMGILIIAAWAYYDLGEKMNKNIVVHLIAITILLVFSCKSYLQAGNWKNSETIFRHGVEVNNNDYISHLNLGATLKNQGKLDEAEYHFREAIRIKPDYSDACYNLATVYVEKGKLDEALRYFYETIRISPFDADAHYYMGILLASKGKVGESIDHLQEAIRLNPLNEEAYVMLGSIFEGINDYRGCAYYYQQALRVNPDNKKAKDELQITLSKENSKSGDSTSSTELEDPRTIYDLAVKYAMQGRLENSMILLGRLKRLQPDNPNVFYNLACLYARRDDKVNAVRCLKIAVEKGFSNWKLLRCDKDLVNIMESKYFKRLLNETHPGKL
jgi:tetratricopeptide (TPR) repeat protein